MTDAISWVDQSFFSKDRIILTGFELPIPGLQMFGKHTMHAAVAPLPYHYHENSYEITYVSKGVISFSIQDVDYQLHGGDVLITKPDEIHSTNLSPLSVGELYWFQLNISDLEDFLFLSQNAVSSLLKKMESVSIHKIKTDSREMLSLLKNFFYLCSMQKDFFMASSYLCLFLHKLCDYSSKSHAHLSKDIASVLHYIETHIKEDIPLEQLSSLCNLSTSQFKQKFKFQTGVSPRNFINFQKMEAASQMLLVNKSVTQTAMDLSFNSSNYFSVVFKRYHACTPTQYLKNHTPLFH